jgi:hypothetical protein
MLCQKEMPVKFSPCHHMLCEGWRLDAAFVFLGTGEIAINNALYGNFTLKALQATSLFERNPTTITNCDAGCPHVFPQTLRPSNTRTLRLALADLSNNLSSSRD